MYRNLLRSIFCLVTSFLFCVESCFAVDEFLEECLKLAAARDQKVAVAAEQVDLAQVRITNSIRSFFPQITLQMQNTKGKTALFEENDDLNKQEYNSESYGVRATQPIYEGGGTKANYRYNKLMMDAAKFNYTKTREELYAKVKLAYYEYLTLKGEFFALSKAFEEVESLFQKTRVEYKAKAISELDLAESKNFRDKVANLLSTSKINLDHTTKKLIETVGVNTLEEIPGMVADELPDNVSEISFTKDECISLVQSNNIDVQTARIQMDMGKEKIKISNAKVHPKIYIDAFYGKAGEAYVNVPLELTTSWNIAGKISWSLWGNSFSASYAMDHTDPATIVDASKRIETRTFDAQLALLDDLQYFIDAKESSVSLKQTNAELLELLKESRLAAEKAYNEYIISLNNARTYANELKVEERKLALMRKKNERYEIQTVNLMEEAWKYAEAISSYTRALFTNHSSVVELEKLTMMALR